MQDEYFSLRHYSCSYPRILFFDTQSAQDGAEEALREFRTDALRHEQQRRAHEDGTAASRTSSVTAEALASARDVAALQMRWPDILARCGLPHDLVTAMDRQRAACDAILNSKASIISTFRTDVAQTEAAHADALLSGHARVDALVSRMSTTHAELCALLQREVAAVEAAMIEDRLRAAATSRKELDALFDSRRAMEKQLVESALVREEAEAREMSELHTADTENYARLKVKLETDVAILEQQLEKMKFTYTLNTEKLEYNFRVLTERDSENKTELAGQKSRLARLRGTLGKLHAQYAAMDDTYQVQNEGIRDDFSKVTRQHLELAAKLHAFAAADAALTTDLVSLHTTELAAMASRLKDADRVIGEQLLGEKFVDDTTITTATASLQLGAATPAGLSFASSAATASAARCENTAALAAAAVPVAEVSVGGPSAPPAAQPTPALDVGRHAASPTGDTPTPAVSILRVQALLAALVDECSTALWDSATAADVLGLTRNGDALAAFEHGAAAILRSLGCAYPDELESLAALCASSGVTRFERAAGVSPSSAAAAATAAEVAPPTLARVVHQWLQSREADGEEARRLHEQLDSPVAMTESGSATATSAAAGATLRGLDSSGVGTLSSAPGAASLQISSNYAADYQLFSSMCRQNDAIVRSALRTWKSHLHGAVPPLRIQVWRALESELAKYSLVVEGRQKLMSDIDRLSESNHERKLLLAGCLRQDSTGVCALKVSPSAMLSIPPALHDELRALARCSTAAARVPPVISSAGVLSKPFAGGDLFGGGHTGTPALALTSSATWTTTQRGFAAATTGGATNGAASPGTLRAFRTGPSASTVTATSTSGAAAASSRIAGATGTTTTTAAAAAASSFRDGRSTGRGSGSTALPASLTSSGTLALVAAPATLFVGTLA